MIDRTEILAVATDLTLSAEVVEKDYVLGWLLAAIYAQPALAENWVFKGGTCLKKCYFETYRFSEDLDFTLADGAQLIPGFLQNAFRDVSEWVYERTGIQIPTDQLRFDVYANPRGGTSCQGRIYYIGPLPHPGALPRIKLDLTADELLALPSIDRPVGHPYSDLPEDGITARCYPYEELFGEKVRALGERARPRDLYDVINLFRHSEFRPAAASILDVLRRKCEFKRIPVPTVAMLSGRAQELAADWQNMLGHQLPVLPPFDSFWSVLPELFAWLNGAIPASATGVITPITASANEELFRPAVGTLRRQGIAGSSFIESIRFAGANRLRVDLGYQNSVRRIEPYSLRRSQAGNILVYAVKSDTGEVRGYRLDRMQSVRVTEEAFVPRYAMELTVGERSAILPVSAGSLHSSYRRAPSRSRVSSGPIYIYQCPYCHKQFPHKKQNSHIGPHKSQEGWPCSGRNGYLVDTRW